MSLLFGCALYRLMQLLSSGAWLVCLNSMSLLFGCYLYSLMQLVSSNAWLVCLKLAFGELFLNETALLMLPLSSYTTLVVGCKAGALDARLRRAFFLMSLLIGCYIYHLTQLLSSGAWLVSLKLAFGEPFFFLMSLLFGCYLFRLTHLLSSGSIL